MKTFYAVSLGASPQRPAAICRLFFSLPPWQRVQNRTPGTARCRAGGISAAQHSQASFDGSPVRSRSRMASMPRCVSCAVLACASSSFMSSDIFFHSTDIYTFPVAAGPATHAAGPAVSLRPPDRRCIPPGSVNRCRPGALPERHPEVKHAGVAARLAAVQRLRPAGLHAQRHVLTDARVQAPVQSYAGAGQVVPE